jgi:hypothetical protein
LAQGPSVLVCQHAHPGHRKPRNQSGATDALETTDGRRREILRPRPLGPQAGRHIDPVTEDVLVVNDDVALVHPDPELDPLLHRHFSIALVPALAQIPRNHVPGTDRVRPWSSRA